MNPNLKLFFKSVSRILVVLAVIGLLLFLLVNYTSIDLSMILTYLMYGFFGIIMAGMFILIMGVMFKSIWVGIMHRSDSILLFCPDKVHPGIHLVSNHYHPGGETSDGYTSWHHYFISLDKGKMHLSRKLNNEKDLKRSIEQLQTSTGHPLQPDLGKAARIGSHNKSDESPTHFTSSINDYRIHIIGFESWVDFGFKISCYKNDVRLWKKTV